jgi:HAD superfamily hydrolase (TIGR01509 family)
VTGPAPQAALLFDLDGTLIDTDHLHFAVFRDLLAAGGRQIDMQYYLDQMHGQMNAAIFARLMPDADPDMMSDRKEAAFRDLLAGSVPPIAGAPRLLADARAQGWGLAVVTNAPRENAAAMLAAIGLADAFDTVVIGEECVNGKPDPEPYATAMSRLGVPPGDCIAFEDSPSGIRSARAAGALTVGLTSSLDDAALRAAGAHASIADFTDPALPPLLARLRAA